MTGNYDLSLIVTLDFCAYRPSSSVLAIYEYYSVFISMQKISFSDSFSNFVMYFAVFTIDTQQPLLAAEVRQRIFAVVKKLFSTPLIMESEGEKNIFINFEFYKHNHNQEWS